jgi:hypothetical protein
MAQAILSPPTLLEMLSSTDPELLFMRLSYLIDEVLDFTTQNTRAVFYSGKNREFAEKWAVVKGCQTLELTPGGKYLDALDLFNNSGIYKDGPPLSAEKASELWDRASRKFAQLCQGYAYVFIEGIEPVNEFGVLRTFFRVELPTLLNTNKNVGTIYFVNNDGSTMGIYTIHVLTL